MQYTADIFLHLVITENGFYYIYELQVLRTLAFLLT